jgi:hypothetical protein
MPIFINPIDNISNSKTISYTLFKGPTLEGTQQKMEFSETLYRRSGKNKFSLILRSLTLGNEALST